VRSLPLPDGSADVSWCRLVIGHLDNCRSVYAELARVTEMGGQVIVTDFHPIAYAAGHRRTFRMGAAVHELEHHVHQLPAHIDAAHAAGLRLVDAREARIGAEVRSFYELAGRDALYQEQLGLPMVLALAFERV
jgi:malonyl-CoA O-methyltransferase